MNVTESVRQVTDYTFRLTHDDLERYLADPQAWAADVRAQLNGAAPIAGGGARVKPPVKGRVKPGPKGKAGRGRRPAKKSIRAKSSKPTLFCPVCELPFKTKGRLANHLKKMHPEYAPA